jgi:hypothetical protein
MDVQHFLQHCGHFSILLQTNIVEVGVKSANSWFQMYCQSLSIGYLSHWRRQIHTSVDDVSFDFLCKYKKGISCELVMNIQQQWWVGNIVNNIKLTIFHSWNIMRRDWVQVLCDDLTKLNPEELGVYRHSQSRCLIVSVCLHCSQLGSLLILDLKALLLVQIVRLST